MTLRKSRIGIIGLALLLTLAHEDISRAADPGGATNFAHDIVIRFSTNAFKNDKKTTLRPEVTSAINQVLSNAYPSGIAVSLLPLVDSKEVAKLHGGKTNVRIMNYYVLAGTFPDGGTNLPLQLKFQVPQIEQAYLPPGVTVPTPPAIPGGFTFGGQRALYNSITGVGARTAWVEPWGANGLPQGACGEGMHVTDLEGGWLLDHETTVKHLPAGKKKLLWGSNLPDNSSIAWTTHGTAVLGVICAKDDPLKRILGIAPHVASVKVVSHSGKTANIPEAIYRAVNDLRSASRQGGPGGVPVIEAQLINLQPVEAQEDIHVAIFDAVNIGGVVVIEAAGNAGINLDTIPQLNRCGGTSVGFEDSGAIMVAAGIVSAAGWSRKLTSNYGSRIDCFAHGENVTTAQPPVNGYREEFNSTSSATAIIAGVALSTQGMFKAVKGAPLNGLGLRTVLTNPLNATHGVVVPPINCAAVGEWIGVMPDLVLIHNAIEAMP